MATAIGVSALSGRKQRPKIVGCDDITSDKFLADGEGALYPKFDNPSQREENLTDCLLLLLDDGLSKRF